MPFKFSPPGGERTFDSLVSLGLGALFSALNIRFWLNPASPDPAGAIQLAVGTLLLAGGVLLWFRLGWARWLVIAAFVVIAALSAHRSYTRGFSLWMVLGPAALAWHAWDVFRHFSPQALADSDPDASTSEPLISLVLLLRRPRHLEATLLARYAESVWSTPFHAGNQPADETGPGHWVVGQTPIFLVSAPDGLFMVHNLDRPYFNEPAELAEKVGELRLRKVLEENRGWLAVDLMQLKDETAPRESAYSPIARFIAELAGPDCQAIFQPATDRFNHWDDALETRLRSGEVADVFEDPTQIPVIQVPDDDPRMQAAVAEARERWPEFTAAFHARDGEGFSVKAPVTVGENTEFIWVNVDSLGDETITGRLGNDPVDLGDLREGSPVTVAVADLNDWAFLRAGQPVGMFTVQVIAAVQQERQAAANAEAA